MGYLNLTHRVGCDCRFRVTMSCLQRRNYGNLGETVNAMLEMNAMATSNKFDTMETVAHDFNKFKVPMLRQTALRALLAAGAIA